MEKQLCVGQAHDALRKLRNMLGLKSFLVKRKYRTAGGQGMLTRSEADIQRASCQVKKWKEVYQHAWRALERLRGDEVIDERNIAWLQLQPLDDCDCIMLSQWLEEDHFWHMKGEMAEAEAAKRGGGRRELPWIWKMEFDLRPTSEGVLGAIEGWTTEERTWREQAERQEHEAKLAGRNQFHCGAAAFAHRHVAIFGRLAATVKAHFHEISLK
ncbi:hypothetical protein K439DRAFT_1625336 [Ramaria rubella]|nr:hypothetical protein K439DRAFT_1625336 [Ramaria rubella]